MQLWWYMLTWLHVDKRLVSYLKATHHCLQTLKKYIHLQLFLTVGNNVRAALNYFIFICNYWLDLHFNTHLTWPLVTCIQMKWFIKEVHSSPYASCACRNFRNSRETTWKLSQLTASGFLWDHDHVSFTCISSKTQQAHTTQETSAFNSSF